MSPGGPYALLLHLATPHRITVGALGDHRFPAGWYLYLGSARGPGGLAARVARHRRTTGKRLHWHIDYLRGAATVAEVWTSTDEAQQECDWSAAAAALPGAHIVPRFGSSDCRCASHLVYCMQRPELDAFASLVKAELIQEHLSREE